MVIQHGLSIEEYLALPEEKPYLEYIHGEAVPKMAPDRIHGTLAAQLAALLAGHKHRHGGTVVVEARVRFADRHDLRYLLPDVAYYAPGRPLDAGGAMAPPTLAVEIRSPEQPLESQREKCRYYRAHGVDSAWVVDAEARAVEVFEGSARRVLEVGEDLTSIALPGFSLPVADPFAGLEA
ncbi:MAG: Uma2 family endonuclease [Thermoflexaceae bacterium]|nr:Uma2 family endonuclease [Thermoflexaceae bacterium]